uniref:Uncharacterized protein n=1 Tax=Arundo donax TaxID=35708 RepID=A0A0A9DIS3_ARUDO
MPHELAFNPPLPRRISTGTTKSSSKRSLTPQIARAPLAPSALHPLDLGRVVVGGSSRRDSTASSMSLSVAEAGSCSRCSMAEVRSLSGVVASGGGQLTLKVLDGGDEEPIRRGGVRGASGAAARSRRTERGGRGERSAGR